MDVMAKGKFIFELKNLPSELDTLTEKVDTFGNSHGLSPKCIFQINLALDELFTNIIQYGFNDGAEHSVKFALSHENETVVIRVEDSGVAFNPVAIDTPEPIDTIEKCKIGGLGIHIIKRLMDDIIYKRTKGKNITVLKKHVTHSSSADQDNRDG